MNRDPRGPAPTRGKRAPKDPLWVWAVATLVGPDGREVGTSEQPLLWHPMIYHYGRN